MNNQELEKKLTQAYDLRQISKKAIGIGTLTIALAAGTLTPQYHQLQKQHQTTTTNKYTLPITLATAGSLLTGAGALLRRKSNHLYQEIDNNLPEIDF